MHSRQCISSSLLAIGLVAAFLPAPLKGAQAAKAATAPKPPVAVLGIRPGMDLDDAHALLQKQGGTLAAGRDKNDAPKDADKPVTGASAPDLDKPALSSKDKDAMRPKRAASDEDDDEGHQEAWKLPGTSYAQVALASDDKGRVLWVTGFVRPGKEMPFATLGDTKQAAAVGPAFAVWNVIIPHKSYRVVARGRGGKASVVSMLTIPAANPNGIFSPQIIPPSLR